VEEGARSRYDRLMKSKGGKVLVGVEHGVCGGCHMHLPPCGALCQTDEEIVQCPQCSRILYCTPEMDLTPSET